MYRAAIPLPKYSVCARVWRYVRTRAVVPSGHAFVGVPVRSDGVRVSTQSVGWGGCKQRETG